MTDTEPVRYRFPPLDRNGWLLGLSGAQCALLAIGLLGVGLLIGSSPPAAAATLALAAAAALATWHGQPAHEHLPVIAGWVIRRSRHRTTWQAPLHPAGHPRVELPKAFGRLDILEVPAVGWPSATAAVVHDRAARTCSITVAASGRGFGLAERAEQERLLAGWGEVLAGFCSEHHPVLRLTVSAWAGPAGIDDLDAHADRHAATADGTVLTSYRELLADAAPAALRHETLLTITVAAGTRRQGSAEAAAAIAVEQARLLAARLDAAGIDVSPPLDTTRLSIVLRTRLDPTAATRLTTRFRAIPGASPSPGNAGPLAINADWDHVRVDGSTHTVFWVADWPRLPVGPAWLEPLLLHAGGTRTFTVVVEPVPARLAARQIRRDATRLASDETQRERSGWRIGAGHRRASEEVAQREEEIAAGYAEVTYLGLLTVTAPTAAALAAGCVDYEDAAGRTGIELRRLNGRHDHTLAAALLPLGRPVPEPRLR